jgi:hypothetical protein
MGTPTRGSAAPDGLFAQCLTSMRPGLTRQSARSPAAVHNHLTQCRHTPADVDPCWPFGAGEQTGALPGG